VLSGVTAAILAKGLDPFTAACAAVFLHARAGRLAAERIGPDRRDRLGRHRGAARSTGYAGAVTTERALARIDLGAITRNCERLAAGLAGGSALGVVVKADGYGHGAARRRAQRWRAEPPRLFVATAEEARALGEQPVPVAIMGALTPQELDVALAAGAEITGWDEDFAAALPPGTRAHVKLDTGMGRLGTREPAEATRVAEAVEGAGGAVAGLMTHFATADERGDDFLGIQLERVPRMGRAAARALPGRAPARGQQRCDAP